jgi:CBS domain containing-hemolysin-like protein
VPLLVLVTRGLSRALAASPLGDALLRSFLPTFQWLELPLRPFSALVVRFEHLARGLFDLPASAQSRRIVEGLREAIEDAGREGDLDETEREIIENVVTFRDEAVASIMTPRTEVHGVERSTPLWEALKIAAQAGHSRLPVYAETLDTVVGIFSVRDCLRLISEEGLEGHELSELIRPATFVPETKGVFELLGDFRRQNLHMAVVLDEYGGTAGIVTLGDVLYELVGDLPDEFEATEPAGIRRIADGDYEIDGSERISDVNAELDIELPEDQGYETVAGFVLAELGHFPRPKETFQRADLRVTVLKATDRRVLEVRLERPSLVAR